MTSSVPFLLGAYLVSERVPGWGVHPFDLLQGALSAGARVDRLLGVTPCRMVGFLPSGVGPGGGLPLVSLFWSLPVGTEDALLADGVDAFKHAVLTLAPDAAPLLDQVQSTDDLVMARYWDVRMPRFHTDRAVVIGDAAHATSPQLGQGASLALVDAWTLARALASEPTVPAALAVYERHRRPHLRYYQWASRWLTPVFQSHLFPVAWPRDLLMGPVCRAPFFRDLMLTTLAGVQTGPSSTLAPSPARLQPTTVSAPEGPPRDSQPP